MELNKEILHMLGYCTEEQWKDAFEQGLDKEILIELLKAVDERYDMNMYEEMILNKI